MNWDGFHPWYPYSSMEEYLAAQGITLGQTQKTETVTSITENDGVTTILYGNGMQIMVGGGNMVVTHNGRVYNMYSPTVDTAAITAARGRTAGRGKCTVTVDGKVVAQVSGETVVNLCNVTSANVSACAGVAIYDVTNLNVNGFADLLLRDVKNATVTASAFAVDGAVRQGNMDVAALEGTVTPLEKFSSAISSGAMAHLPTVSSVDGKNVINVSDAVNVSVQGAAVVAIHDAVNVNLSGGNAASICDAVNVTARGCQRVGVRDVLRANVNGQSFLGRGAGGGNTTVNSRVIIGGNTTVTVNGRTVTGGDVDVNAILGNVFGNIFGNNFGGATVTGGGRSHVTTTVNGHTVTGGGSFHIGDIIGSVLSGSFTTSTTTSTTTTTTTTSTTTTTESMDELLQKLFRIGITVTKKRVVDDDEREGTFKGTVEDADAKGKTYSPELFQGHVFLTSRNRGWSKKLVGKVTLVNLMVDDTSAVWASEKDVRALKKDVQEACDVMQKHAGEYGVKLDLHPVYHRVQIECKAGRTNHDNFREKLPKALGCKTMKEVHEKFKKQYGGDEVALVVMPHHAARSFAFMADDRSSDKYAEYAMVYEEGWSHDRAGTYIHEVFHVFGAVDFYYPEDAVRACERLFPNSIMRYSGINRYFDPVTRYLIGWTDRLTKKAKDFLEETKHLTRFQVESARRKA